MFEKIDTRETFSPVTSTTKVKEVDQRDGDMQRRRFIRQLREEEEKNKKGNQTRRTTVDSEIEDEEQQEKKRTKSDDFESPEFDTKEDAQGKVIDILV
jgi:hypothetical protein